MICARYNYYIYIYILEVTFDGLPRLSAQNCFSYLYLYRYTCVGMYYIYLQWNHRPATHSCTYMPQLLSLLPPIPYRWCIYSCMVYTSYDHHSQPRATRGRLLYYYYTPGPNPSKRTMKIDRKRKGKKGMAKITAVGGGK